MMEKIKIITDSACDIPIEDEKRYPNLEILCIPVCLNGREYFERKDFTCTEFYDMLLKAPEIPATSHITNIGFMESFAKAAGEGYQDIIVVTINSKGSGMYEAACMGKDMFYQEYPQYSGIHIHIVDSMTYSIVYGYAILNALEKIEQGADAEEILQYFDDYFHSVEVYFSVFSLDFAKRSGRISCAAAFIGDVLGLRPIISIIDGEMKIVEKVRGDKNVPPHLAAWYAKRNKADHFPYITLEAKSVDHSRELQAEMTKLTGYPPKQTYQAGVAISINSGPTIIGVLCIGENRKKQ